MTNPAPWCTCLPPMQLPFNHLPAGNTIIFFVSWQNLMRQNDHKSVYLYVARRMANSPRQKRVRGNCKIRGEIIRDDAIQNRKWASEDEKSLKLVPLIGFEPSHFVVFTIKIIRRLSGTCLAFRRRLVLGVENSALTEPDFQMVLPSLVSVSSGPSIRSPHHPPTNAIDICLESFSHHVVYRAINEHYRKFIWWLGAPSGPSLHCRSVDAV